MNFTELIHKIKNEENIVLYGAQMVAASVYTALKTICNPSVSYFIVSNMTNNPNMIDGISVIELSKYNSENSNTLILIATPAVHHFEISQLLKNQGFNNYICIDSSLENKIMSEYYNKIHKFHLLANLDFNEYVAGCREKSAKMYMVKSPVDHPLSGTYDIQDWYVQILAGADLTDKYDGCELDNIGDNISIKNRNYCELTATYWVWKHAISDFVGICHYRRILNLKKSDIVKMCNFNVDVVLPFPTICYPNAEEHHRRYISEADWDTLKKALSELAPDYEEAFNEIFHQKYFYNFNIFLAEKTVFDEFCQWMFPILERVEEICENENPNRKNRYMGYIGESLMTLYFMKNLKDLRIEHCGNILLL